MKIKQSRIPEQNVSVVRLEGEFKVRDITSIPNLDDAIKEVEGYVILDLAGITEFDSTGLVAIMKARLTLEDRQQPMVLVSPPSRLKKILKIVRLTDFLPVFDSVEEAVQSFTGSA